MTKRRKKSATIEEAGVRVRIFKRGAWFWLDVRHGETRRRVSAETTDRATAEANAHTLAREIAKRELLGIVPDRLTLGQLFDAYHEHKGRHLEGQWKRAAVTHERLFRTIWGESLPVVGISQTSVDRFSGARRAAYVDRQRAAHAARVAKLAARATAKGIEPPHEPEPTFRALRDGALDADFRWVSSVFNWATKHRLPTGDRLLSLNPLHGCKWPREKPKNILRPVATHDRYLRTIGEADAIDPAGRFRLVLALARYTARRIDAILHLNASDLLLSTDRVRSALAAAAQDEGLAESMRHGAIRWRQEFDKQGIERITPLSPAARAEVDRYVAAARRVGDVPLFPSVDDTEKPLSRSAATKWLSRAEKAAGLEKLKGGLFHAYRRLWATERKDLPDVDVAEAGGWTGTKAMKQSYQQHTTAGVLRAVNMDD